MLCLSFMLVVFYVTINTKEICAADNNTISIRLCCKPSEYLNTTSPKCENLPADFNLTTWEITNFWSTGVAGKVNILSDLKHSVGMFCQKPFLYKFFEYKNDSEHCYSPYYHKQKQKYIIATLDCDFTAKTYIFIYNTYVFGIGISLIFLLTTLILNMKPKELRQLMLWKLFLCYVISWLCSHLLVIFCICLMCIEMVPVLWFCFISSRLWLNVMGYEEWLHFMYTFKDCDLDCGRKRFLLYSLYAWGMAILSTLCSWLLKDLSARKTLSFYISSTVILLLTAVVFAYIVYKLFALRLKVLDTVKGKHFIRKSALVLLGIFYLMILPWIAFPLWLLYPRNIAILILFYIHLLVEGPILFAIFVPKRALRFQCCKRSDGQAKENDVTEEMQRL